MADPQHKDERLAWLADAHNAAQFVSFGLGPAPAVRHCRIREWEPDAAFNDVDAAVGALFGGDVESVNVRSYVPDRWQGNPFHYGIKSAGEAAALVRSLAAEGYHTIVNETVDVDDGGVSGVAQGGIIEFAPGDTPRAVEKPGVASLPRPLALRLFETVYGFRPELPEDPGQRVEFSLHPLRVGYRHSHTLLWELESVDAASLSAAIAWPNRFSRFVGDKTYGLLVADLLGFPVPRATVFARGLGPFAFGRPTGTGEVWLRTCPREQQSGRFATVRGWTDPFRLLAAEDPDGSQIAAVLAQEAVDARFSGATLPQADGQDFVEGVAGAGAAFMLGSQAPEPLPPAVVDEVRTLAAAARQSVGPVHLEWAHDGTQAWILQMTLSTDEYQGGVISPGEPSAGWLDYDPAAGLPALREAVTAAQTTGRGIIVHGSVGVTSHIGDVLRRADVPARIRTTTSR
jgi:hypothetical protein